MTKEQIERFEDLIDVPDWMRDGTGHEASEHDENMECWHLWEEIKKELELK